MESEVSVGLPRVTAHSSRAARFTGSVPNFPRSPPPGNPLHTSKPHQASPLLWDCPNPTLSGLVLPLLSHNLRPLTLVFPPLVPLGVQTPGGLRIT